MPRYDGSTLVMLETTKGQRVSHPWVSPACGEVTHSVFGPERGQERADGCVRKTGWVRQTGWVTEVRPAADAAAARWLLQPDVDWWVLVRYGPPGFDVYLRIAFPDADIPPSDRVDPVRAALVTLASHTTTPDRGYAAIWEGWCGEPPAKLAPRVNIPNREMLLFTGRVETLRDAPELAWHGPPAGYGQEPHLVWPEDQAWCLACEVDEEIEFTVGCSRDASKALASTLPGSVRQVHYGDPAPMYRDEQ